MLTVARRSAIKARTQAINQLHALVVTAPDQVKHQLRGLSPKARVNDRKLRRRAVSVPVFVPVMVTRSHAYDVLRLLARRYQTLTAEIGELDTGPLCARANPALLATTGIGPDTAAALLVAAGDNPERMRSKLPSLPCAAPGPGILRTIVRPQPRWRPPSQQRFVAYRHHSDALRPDHHRIRKTPGGRQNPPRDHPLSETPHRPPGLPTVDRPTPNTQRRRSTLFTPKNPDHSRSGRHSRPCPPNALATRTRPLPQPPLATRYQQWP